MKRTLEMWKKDWAQERMSLPELHRRLPDVILADWEADRKDFTKSETKKYFVIPCAVNDLHVYIENIRMVNINMYLGRMNISLVLNNMSNNYTMPEVRVQEFIEWLAENTKEVK